MAATLTRRRNNVKVFIRILPSVDFSHDNIKVDDSFKIISIRCLQDFQRVVSITNDTLPSFWSFTTDGVYYNASQEQIYEGVLSDVVDKILAGQNVILMSYGQTGSGKSFTASGLRNRYEHRGLAPRLLGNLFEQKHKHEEDMAIRYKMSFVEVIGREIKDLLAAAMTEKNANARISNQNVIKNALAVDVSCEEEGLKLIFEGESRQTMCEGAPYPGSNMGHGILTIHVESTSLLISQASRMTAKIHVLDMAGIDTAGKQTSIWKMPRDIGKANITKSILQQYLSHLESPDDNERLSPVIGYLGNTISKDSTLRLVGHIRATDKDLDITLSTLRLGERVSGMLCKKVKISNLPKRDLKLQKKAAEVEWLRGRVELAAMLESQTDWKQNNLPQYRISQIHDMAQRYISDQVSDIKVRSVMENLIIMQDFKEAYNQLKQAKGVLDLKLAALAEDAELAREKNLLEIKERNASTGSKISKVPSSTTGSLGSRNRGKKSSSKNLGSTKEKEEDIPQTPLVPPPPPLVGELINTGITIGPGFISDYQGEVTKASKRDIRLHKQLSAEQHDRLITGTPETKPSSIISLREQFRCAQEFSSDSESESKQRPLWSPLPPVTSSTPHEQAWEEFVAIEGVYAAELQAAIEQARLDAETAFKKHVQTCLELKDLCVAVNRTLHELLNEQHQRHVTGREDYDNDGRILVGENERRLVTLSKQQEAEITTKREMLIQGVNELNECITRLNEARKSLDDKFKEFGAQTVTTSPTEVELRNEQSEITSRQDTTTELQRSKHYQSLQHLNFNTNDCKVLAHG